MNSIKNNSEQLVRASDLDRWVRQADEYRELYMNSQTEILNQAERYEHIIGDLKA